MYVKGEAGCTSQVNLRKMEVCDSFAKFIIIIIIIIIIHVCAKNTNADFSTKI